MKTQLIKFYLWLGEKLGINEGIFKERKELELEKTKLKQAFEDCVLIQKRFNGKWCIFKIMVSGKSKFRARETGFNAD